MEYSFYLVSVLLVFAFETGTSRPIKNGLGPSYAEDTDLLVDAALQMVRGFLKKNALDPMTLPDINIHTDTKFIGIKVNIYFDASDLVLRGLSTLQKTDYLQVSLKPDNMVNIRAVVKLNDLSVVGKARLKAGVFSTDVASIYIEKVQVLAEMELPRDESGERKPRVTTFEIQEIGKITIKRGHSGMIHEWLDKGASFIVNKFRDTMKTQIAPLILENVNIALAELTHYLF